MSQRPSVLLFPTILTLLACESNVTTKDTVDDSDEILLQDLDGVASTQDSINVTIGT